MIERRGGIFCVGQADILSPLVRKMMSEFVVVEASWRFDLRALEYHALHEKLPMVAEGNCFPAYTLRWRTTPIVGTFALVRLWLEDEVGNEVLEWFA